MAVTNDLVSDNRVHKMASTLVEMGYDVTLLGRIRKNSPNLQPRNYKTIRFRLLADKGPAFYAFYNLRLLGYLIMNRFDVIHANDLDSLPACFLASKLANRRLVYDSHELFTEVPELVTRPRTQRIWERIERMMLPKLTNCITVCQSIADFYEKKYGTHFEVVRNVPFLQKEESTKSKACDEIKDTPIVLYQGAVNINRGVEEAILAMHYVENVQLVIVGNGDILDKCVALVNDEKLSNRVHFTGRLPLNEVIAYTRKAAIGLSVEKDVGLNYRFALPNKLFDYIGSGIPVIVSNLPEMSRIAKNYNIGVVIDSIDPKTIASAINKMLNSPDDMSLWSKNCLTASRELCWENEKEIIRKVYSSL